MFISPPVNSNFSNISYHFLLKGNIERKREILNTIASKFEAVRPQLKAIGFKDIESDAGYLINNIHIRHNNADPQSTSYKTYIATTEEEIRDASSSIYMDLNDEMKLYDLLCGLMMRSGNDCAYLIASNAFSVFNINCSPNLPSRIA